MERLGVIITLVAIVAYPIYLVRAASQGKRWAIDTLRAMAYLNGGMPSLHEQWLRPPPDEPDEVVEEPPERLVA